MTAIANQALSADASSRPSGGIPSPTRPSLLLTAEDHRAVRAAWKAYANSPKTPTWRGPSARDMALYCLLTGKSLAKAFSPIQNQKKLLNGARPYWSLMEALTLPALTSASTPIDDFLQIIASPRLLRGPGFGALAIARESLFLAACNARTEESGIEAEHAELKSALAARKE